MNYLSLFYILSFGALCFINKIDNRINPLDSTHDVTRKVKKFNTEKEVKATLKDIEQSIREGDVDKLISFHAYGPKFTEFKNGEHRVGSAENEAHERAVFSSVTEVVKFDFNDLKIAVFGEVANVTFHSDFQLKFGDDLVVVNDQITLLFVKTNGEWKIVHEHHAPLKSGQ